jgi:short-subunit dehydrogenase
MNKNFFQAKKIWIIGANSDIAKEFILCVASIKSGITLKLFSRNMKELKQFINTQNIEAECIHFDITNIKKIVQLPLYSDVPDGIVIAAAYDPPENCTGDYAEITKTISTNYTGCVLLLEAMKNKLKGKRCGFVSVLSSLAGERGKMSNSVYASTKSGLTCYLEGLEQELTPSGVSVTIIKPAWVKTKMTINDMRVQKSFIAQTPAQVASIMFHAIKKRRRGAIYTSIWAFCIGIIIKLIPGFIYRHLSL